MDATVIQVAALFGAAGAALVLVGRTRIALTAGFPLLAGAEAALAYALAPSRNIHAALASPARAGAVVVGLLVVAAVAYALFRFPAYTAVALAAVAPFRVPVRLSGTEAFLLVPLYVVLGAAGIAFLARMWAKREVVVALSPWLAVPVAAFIALTGISALWSLDVEASAVDLLFFYFPFAGLTAIVARTLVTARATRALGIVTVAVAVGLGLIGLWQLESNHLFFAHDVQRGNAYSTYHRTTSLFHDPSIYGRYLVVAILVLVVALWFERVGLWLATGLVAFLSAALFFTYSQSSMVSLVAALVLITLVAGDRRSRIVVLASALVLLLAGTAVVGAAAHSESLKRATSGRSDLIVNASEIARDHPFAGVGINAEERATRRLVADKPNRLKKVSHTTPLTVAAELGAIGILAYLAYLAGAARVFLDAVRRNRLVGLAVASVFFAVFVHALFYSGFFEDPLIWLSLAIAAAMRLSPSPS